MIYISHRGNIHGPKPDLENSAPYVEDAIARGFDVEVDLWVANGGIYLGHDGPQYLINSQWLSDRSHQLWVHCKNTQALDLAVRLGLNAFFHNVDDYTITTRGYVWAYPGKQVASHMCIGVMPEKVGGLQSDWKEKYSGICSDYIGSLKSQVFKPIDHHKHFVIGTPLVAWKCDAKEHLDWIADRVEIINRFPNVKWFASFELDKRGLEPFSDVIDALKEVNGDYWTYSINDMQQQVTSSNRWIRIETGRNLIREFAQRTRITSGHHWGEDCSELNYGVVNYSAILYVDSDIHLTADVVEKMLEIDRPIVGVDVPSYCLTGKTINESPRVEEHWTTAGCMLVNAPAFYDLPWYHNAYLNLSDDPTFQSMAERLLRREGVSNLDTTYGMTWVRKDIQALHKGRMVPVEQRKIDNRQIN